MFFLEQTIRAFIMFVYISVFVLHQIRYFIAYK